MTPRGTDWSLAGLVAVLGLSGALTLFGGAWVFVAHDVAGFALGGVLVWKLRRVWRRIGTRRAGLIALAFVAGTLLTGVAWSSAIRPTAFGYNAAQPAQRARGGARPRRARPTPSSGRSARAAVT